MVSLSNHDLILRRAQDERVLLSPTGDQGLAIEMIDPLNNALVWRGSGQLRVEYSATPEQRRARAGKVVDAILKQFPSRRAR